jgi:hypothetical protein
MLSEKAVPVTVAANKPANTTSGCNEKQRLLRCSQSPSVLEWDSDSLVVVPLAPTSDELPVPALVQTRTEPQGETLLNLRLLVYAGFIHDRHRTMRGRSLV